MRLALCNEVLAEMPFEAQCDYAAELGYDGIELAPFTLSDEPHLLDGAGRARVRRAVASSGITITGLHWLLVKPDGLSITSSDDLVRHRTREVMRRLCGLCAELGGRVLVHGSPKQRMLVPGEEAEGARRAADSLRAAAEAAEDAGVVYCIEPLSPNETPYLNTVEEAARLVDAIGSPALRTMIDTCAAAQAESATIPELLQRWLPSGHIAHIQLNDRNRRAPGQGSDRFTPIVEALRVLGYEGTIAIEPFIYNPDGRATAARAIGYLRGILEAMS